MAMVMSLECGCGVEARAPGACAVSPTNRDGGPPRVSAKIQPYGLRGVGERQETVEHGHGGGMQCTMGMR